CLDRRRPSDLQEVRAADARGRGLRRRRRGRGRSGRDRGDAEAATLRGAARRPAPGSLRPRGRRHAGRRRGSARRGADLESQRARPRRGTRRGACPRLHSEGRLYGRRVREAPGAAVKLWRQGTRTPEWWLAAALGFGLIALDLTGQAHRGVADARVLYFLATMTVALLVGLWAWAWRSPPRMGKLMYLWPVLVVMADLPNAYPDSRVASTIGLATFV